MRVFRFIRKVRTKGMEIVETVQIAVCSGLHLGQRRVLASRGAATELSLGREPQDRAVARAVSPEGATPVVPKRYVAPSGLYNHCLDVHLGPTPQATLCRPFGTAVETAPAPNPTSFLQTRRDASYVTMHDTEEKCSNDRFPGPWVRCPRSRWR